MRSIGGPDVGASEVVGSILMVAITVAVAAGLFTVVYGALADEDGVQRASFTGSIQANDASWGSGDETVRVSHKGGHAVPVGSLAVVVQIAGTETRYAQGGPQPLDHGSQDAFGTGDEVFTIGERWTSTDLTIPPQTRVALTVVDTTTGNVLWSGSLRSGDADCDPDEEPPSVSGWAQTPADVTTDTTGPVGVEATLADDCGLDTTTDPHLHYRVNDGANPSFSDAGAMTLQSGTTWEGSIPDQTWADHGDETLEYKLVGMSDEAGNTDDSALQQDRIDACPDDTDPPTVASWTQDPSDVTTATTGPVNIQATLADDCAGVDTTSDPHLHYRVNDGANPSFTDAGAMTLQSGTTWEGSIPDQTWADHGDETLEYKLVDMSDEQANTGESSLQQDTIQQTSSISYVQTPLAMVIGTASNDADARSADDADAAATLSEASTGSTPSTMEQFGTASTGTANNPENSEGAPDDQYTQFQTNGEAATVSGFPADSGTITQVEIALEGVHDGGRDTGQSDVMRLSHDQGPTEQTYPLSTTETQHFLDVTSDRSWTWTDIQNLGVTATCECHDTNRDNRQFLIDTLWVRVTTSTPTYELETDAWTFDPLGAGSTHTLEIRYRTDTVEDYQLQTWDGSTWTTQAPLLDQGSFTVFSEDLTAAEVSAGPQIRILDQGSADGSQGSIDIDYARVVSS